MAESRVGQQLKDDGEKIIAMATTFDTILREAFTLVEQIDSGWEGLSNVAFMADYDRIRTNLLKMPDMIKGFGDSAVKAAEAYETTDTTGAKR